MTLCIAVGAVGLVGCLILILDFLYIPLACVIAACSGWMASVVWGTLGIRWSMYLLLSTVTTTICSLLVFRAHGYRLRRIAMCQDGARCAQGENGHVPENNRQEGC